MNELKMNYRVKMTTRWKPSAKSRGQRTVKIWCKQTKRRKGMIKEKVLSIEWCEERPSRGLESVVVPNDWGAEGTALRCRACCHKPQLTMSSRRALNWLCSVFFSFDVIERRCWITNNARDANWTAFRCIYELQCSDKLICGNKTLQLTFERWLYCSSV